MKELISLIDYLLPKSFKSDFETLRKGRLLIFSCIAVIIFSLSYIPLFILSGFMSGMIINVYGALSASFVAFKFRKSGNFIFYGNFFTCTALLFFMTYVVLTKGLYSPMLIWLSIVPLSGFLYVNKSSGIFWTVATLLFISILYVMEELGFVFTVVYPESFSNILYYTNAGGAIVYIVVIIFMYEKGHEIVKERLKKANIKIVEKSQQLEAVNEETTQQSEQLARTITQLTDSVRYAERIQSAILPNQDIVKAAFRELFIFFKPRDIVSGDFYWFHELSVENRIVKILIAADCTGHGVPGAFMTMIANGLLNEIVITDQFWKPDEILISLDERLQNLLKFEEPDLQISDGMDISVISLDESKNKLYFSGAKNPIYYVRNANLHALPASRYSIGSSFYTIQKKFELHEIKIRPGDIFYMFSDGFPDQFGGSLNKKYMRKNLRKFLEVISHLPMNEQRELLVKEFETWKGNMMQTDDVLILGVAF